jgi:hypothetical protein
MKRRLRWTILYVLLAAIVAGLTPAPAEACSCVSTPGYELAYAKADSVFLGEVAGSRSDWFGLFGGHWLRHEILFDVASTWKGVSVSQVIVGITSNSCCDWSPLSLSAGDVFMVYANVNARGEWETSYWHGTQEITGLSIDSVVPEGGKPPSESVNLRQQFYASTYLLVLVVVGGLSLATVWVIRQNRLPRTPKP